MHLVKESRPYLSNGFTSRSHNNFLAEAKGGLEPIVVTEPGFPRVLKGEPFKTTSSSTGFGMFGLTLARSTTRRCRLTNSFRCLPNSHMRKSLKYRPSVIHASSGRRGFDTALVGLALQEKTGLPFVYEVRSFFEGNWTGTWRGSLKEKRFPAGCGSKRCACTAPIGC